MFSPGPLVSSFSPLQAHDAVVHAEPCSSRSDDQ